MVNKDLSPLSPIKKGYNGDQEYGNSPDNEPDIRRLDSNVTHNTDNNQNY